MYCHGTTTVKDWASERFRSRAVYFWALCPKHAQNQGFGSFEQHTQENTLYMSIACKGNSSVATRLGSYTWPISQFDRILPGGDGQLMP